MGGIAWLAYYFQVRGSIFCSECLHILTFNYRQVFLFDEIYGKPSISDLFYPDPPDLSGPALYLSAALERQRWAQVCLCKAKFCDFCTQQKQSGQSMVVGVFRFLPNGVSDHQLRAAAGA